MKIALACDHGGFKLKEHIKRFLASEGVEVLDFGTFSEDSVDYPDFAIKAIKALLSGEVDRAILMCGTGIGMSIVANRFPGIRAALCHDVYTAKMSRLHNDANVLVMGGRVLSPEVAQEMVKVWLTEPFEGGRHERRLRKIEGIERMIKEEVYEASKGVGD